MADSSLSAVWTRIYTNLVFYKRWTIDQVPASYQDAVKAAVAAKQDA